MRSGVHELWLVDPDACTVTRVQPHSPDEALGEEDTLRSELLGGFAVRVAGLFPFKPE
jgi:hypothetical protein